jgi:hypothetical protein
MLGLAEAARNEISLSALRSAYGLLLRAPVMVVVGGGLTPGVVSATVRTRLQRIEIHADVNKFTLDPR